MVKVVSPIRAVNHPVHCILLHVMHGRLPCVGHADSGMLRTGDPAGLGRLRRNWGPGVRPRSVSYSGRRAAMGGGNGR